MWTIQWYRRAALATGLCRLSLTAVVAAEQFEGDIEDDEGEDLGLCTPKQLSPTGARQGAAMHDHFNGSSGLSGSVREFLASCKVALRIFIYDDMLYGAV